MVALKRSESHAIDRALQMESGYVLDFSDRTMAEFFEDEFDIDIYDDKYSFKGSSKAKRVRAFIEVEDNYAVARVLRRLWEYREKTPHLWRGVDNAELRAAFLPVLGRIESGAATPRTDAIDRFKHDETLNELIAAIERDVAANKPVAALDRLHTFCMKKFGHLLDVHGVQWERAEPLHSRVGKYVRALEQGYELRDITRQIMKNSIGIFEKFNHVRNNDTLAHDNELPNQADARFIFDAVTAILRFVKSVEAGRFEA